MFNLSNTFPPVKVEIKGSQAFLRWGRSFICQWLGFTCFKEKTIKEIYSLYFRHSSNCRVFFCVCGGGGGKLSLVLWSEISFYATREQSSKKQFVTMIPTIYSPNHNFHAKYPHSKALFGIFICKVYYFAPHRKTLLVKLTNT